MNSSLNSSKLKKKTKRKSRNQLLSGTLSSTPVRSPSSPFTSAYTPPRRSSLSEQSFSEESLPSYCISSQAPIPEKEVYWDYDTPQIKKYKSQLGIGKSFEDDDSPVRVILEETVSTPKLRMHCEPRAPQVINTSAARDAYTQLLAFQHKLLNKGKSGSQSDEGPAASAASEPLLTAGHDEDLNFSDDDDDDSLLLRCAEEVEKTQRPPSPAQRDSNQVKENLGQESDACIESDDSLEYIMSQMDERDLIIKDDRLDAKKTSPVRVKHPLDVVDHNVVIGSSPELAPSRTIKRARSSDDGVVQRSPAIRRTHSSPVIPENAAVTVPRKCDKAEIEKKRQEAKRRRELSQTKR